MNGVNGLHHITAIAGNPQQNLDFYAGVLGMRLVKRSVNQDDPGTYHLFYADAEGRPGTDLTFFPWTMMARGQKGTGLTTETQLAVPQGSLVFWQQRLGRYGIATQAEQRYGSQLLTLRDPHGLELALVEIDEPRPFSPWEEGGIPAAQQIRGLHGARIWVQQLWPTERFLQQGLGFTAHGSENGWYRYAAGPGGSGQWLEVKELPNLAPGRWGTGSVHHLAWRVNDEAHELAVRQQVAQLGARPTQPIDRFWFKSVYFQEPAGVVFELATDGPGFAVDEEPTLLGQKLVLPPWLEERRAQIEAQLPPLSLPQVRP